MTDDCTNTVPKAREEIADILARALLDMILAGSDREGDISSGRIKHQAIQEQPPCH